jgi:hypothetical protein
MFPECERGANYSAWLGLSLFTEPPGGWLCGLLLVQFSLPRLASNAGVYVQVTFCFSYQGETILFFAHIRVSTVLHLGAFTRGTITFVILYSDTIANLHKWASLNPKPGDKPTSVLTALKPIFLNVH